jgi:hypothetical protein
VRTSLTVLLGVLALAGCGGDSGGPPIDGAVAAKLAKAADGIAASIGRPCGARDRALVLQTRTIAAINAGRIPAAYLEPLQARVNEIVGELQVRCLPAPSPASTQPAYVPPTPTPTVRSGKSRKDKHDKRDHGRKGRDD